MNFTIGAIAPRSESRRRADRSGGEWAVTDLMTDGRRPYHGIDGPAAGFALGDRAQQGLLPFGRELKVAAGMGLVPGALADVPG